MRPDQLRWRLVPRILSVVLLSFLLAGCHRIQAPSAVIRMSDPATAGQLIHGFYEVEGSGGDNSWRWASPDATLALAPPPNAARDGARLRIRLYFPETQIQEVGPIRLTASVDGEELPPETFSKPGGYDFVRDIPACFLDTNVLPVNLSFFPYAPKSKIDGRTLAAVVSMAVLEPK